MPSDRELQERIVELEAALQQSEMRYQAVVDTALAGIGITDPEENLTFVNRAFAEMLGYTREELAGVNLSQLADPEEYDNFQERTEEREATGTRDHYETALRRRDGEKLNVLISASPLTTEKGAFQGTVGVLVDISERKRAEEELQRAYTEVEERVEAQTVELRREVEERERLQKEVVESQKRLIEELATPVIPVVEGIIIMPLVGSVDTMRARDITRSLLAGIREYRARVVILDITSVPIVDSGVADYLNKTVQAARLKGAQTVVTGISDAVAETIVDLGIDWGGMETLSDLQTGLRVALAEVGLRIVGG
jgi:rsbT co-antagonist protein RsbR